MANSGRLGESTKNQREFGKICGHDAVQSAKSHGFCGEKIVKNRIRQQYPEVFWTVFKDWFFASFLSHKALKYPSTYQNMEIVNKSKDGYTRI